MSGPVIAFLTDFGTADHYVASMKAVALALCPDATAVDITHEVPPHDIEAGAYQLVACYKYFAAGTVFVAVIDPGVGSSRRGIAARAGGYLFVGPDNGVFSHVFAERPPEALVELAAAAYARPAISRTFEGRDRFAPAAGWLARGIELEALGPSVTDPLGLPAAQPVARGDVLEGVIIHLDRFGNAVTNIGRVHVEQMFGRPPGRITAGGQPVAGLVETYADCAPGRVYALFGSSDRLELAANRQSAAALLGLRRGAPVVLTP